MPTCVEELQHARPRRRAAHAAVHLEDLADLPLDRVQRIERGHRLLEDHGDAVAAHLAERLLVGVEKLPPSNMTEPPGCMRGRVGQELQDRERRHRFARAGFADQRDRLLRADVEGDAATACTTLSPW